MKQRRTNIQKKQYRFKRTIINTPSYLKYFDPSIEAENWLLGIGEMVSYIEQIWRWSWIAFRLQNIAIVLQWPMSQTYH